MESGTGDWFTARCDKIWKRASPQTRGNQSRSGALTEADKKVAPAKIDGLRRIPCPVQSNVPRRVTCGTETNIRVWAGQGGVGQGRKPDGLRLRQSASGSNSQL